MEVLGDRQFLIDPNFIVDPEKTHKLILITHEHDDHYNPEKCVEIFPMATVYAPEATLNKFDLKGIAVKSGDKIDGIRVLGGYCWKSEESVSYFCKGLLHAGDSAKFPEVEGVKLVFTACFPDYYDDYVLAFKRLRPGMVIPFHYDVKKDLDKAKGLKDRLDKEGINCKLMKMGETMQIRV